MAPDAVYDFAFYGDPGLIQRGHDRVLEIVRDAPPIFWTPRNGGHWIIAGHEAVSKAFNDVELLIPLPNSIDPPRHAIYRAPLQSVFSPSAMIRLKSDIAAITAELIERSSQMAVASSCRRSRRRYRSRSSSNYLACRWSGRRSIAPS